MKNPWKGCPLEIEIEGETIRIPGDALFSIEQEREGGRGGT